MTSLDESIQEKTVQLRQNQEILGKIQQLDGKISSFDQTQAILDSAAVGTDVWNKALAKMASFCSQNKSVWISKLSQSGAGQVNAEGYSLYRNSLTDFAYSIESATLQNMFYEALRDRSAYKFNLNFNLKSYTKKNE